MLGTDIIRSTVKRICSLQLIDPVSVLDLSLTDVRLGWSDCWQGGQRGGWTARRADKRAIVPLVKVKVAKGALRSREARTAPAKRGFRLRFLGRVSGARSQNAN